MEMRSRDSTADAPDSQPCRAATIDQRPLSGPRDPTDDRSASLALFLFFLGGGFALISLNWVNDHAIEPFTAGFARASAGALDLLGQRTNRERTVIRGSRFVVNIRNGCNGIETMLIFLSAVIAFLDT
jgi:hypothetical protein